MYILCLLKFYKLNTYIYFFIFLDFVRDFVFRLILFPPTKIELELGLEGVGFNISLTLSKLLF